jgi:DNA-directed RNA polymerase subunit K/omega
MMEDGKGHETPLEATDMAQKAGGAFRLATLIQKRMRELNAGDRPLVTISTKDPFKIVLEEIRQGKINLILEEEEEEAG